MANKQSEAELPPIEFIPRETRELRKLGSFDSEVKLMIERMEKLKPFREKEVIIEAMGSTRAMCPFDCETWAVNMGYSQIMELDGHCSRIFLTHTQVRDVHGREAFNWGHFNKLVEAGIIVYNTHRVKGLNSKMYPFKRISKKFNTEYFSNTISYMMALAIDEGYKKIRLYGCDMMTQAEYAWEKGGIEYWIGRAEGVGVTVEVNEGSSLLKTITGKPYGVKYFKMKDIDPDGSLRRRIKKSAPKINTTQFVFENPLKPPIPDPTPYVTIQSEQFHGG
jgi:hypothetical protein